MFSVPSILGILGIQIFLIGEISYSILFELFGRYDCSNISNPN